MAAGTELDIGVTVEPGIETVERALSKFGDRLERRGLNAGLTAAAGPIKRRMKAGAPVQPGGGALKKSIGQRALRIRDKTARGIPREARAIFVGVVRKVADPKYKASPGKRIDQTLKAGWVTAGTHPHRIPKKGKGRIAINGKVFSAVAHPGARPNSFIDDAYRAELPNVDENYLKGISKFVDKF
ncbi:MAG: hypothetical protein GY788_07520 [bacterium]|nr:hypothetical protein [bacterium]